MNTCKTILCLTALAASGMLCADISFENPIQQAQFNAELQNNKIETFNTMLSIIEAQDMPETQKLALINKIKSEVLSNYKHMTETQATALQDALCNTRNLKKENEYNINAYRELNKQKDQLEEQVRILKNKGFFKKLCAYAMSTMMDSEVGRLAAFVVLLPPAVVGIAGYTIGLIALTEKTIDWLTKA